MDPCQRCSFHPRLRRFSDSQAAIRSLSGFKNNSGIVRECRRNLDFLSGPFSVSLVWVYGHSNVLGNCRADELARADVLLPEASSIELGIALASVTLAMARKFFRIANLSCVNEES